MTIIYLKSISSDTVGLPCLFFFFNPCFWKRFFYLFLMWWIFLAAWSFSLVVVSGGCSHCSTKASHCRVWALGAWASAVVAHGFTSCSSWTLEHSCGTHGLSSSAACGVFPDQGSNLCLLFWQVDSLLVSHQGSPILGLNCGAWGLHCYIQGLFLFHLHICAESCPFR